MVGHSVTLNIDRPEPVNVTPRLVLDGLTVYDELGVKRLDNVSFTVNAGEVLGVAGVAGSGQRELLESIAGLYPIASGTVTYYDPKDGKTKNLVGMDPMDIRKHGIAMSFVPEDRLGMGLVGSMGMTGNMMLRSWRKGHGVFLNRKDPEELAKRIWQELDVVTPSTNFPVRRMSGGNVQKVLVGREIAAGPVRADDGLRRPRSGYQYILYDLQPADRAENEGHRRGVRGRGSGRAAGAVRPDRGSVRRSGVTAWWMPAPPTSGRWAP